VCSSDLVIINPNNPTGVLYPKEVLESLVQVAREHNLIIFADEIYERLVMDGKEFHNIAPMAPDLCVITMNGLSKSHRVAGFRIGWAVISGRKDHVAGYIEGINMLANMRLCSNVLAQQIVQTALGGYQSVDELLLPGGRIYEQREAICRVLDEIPGISYERPDAAFYIFPKIDTNMYNIEDDEKFVLDLLREKHVMLVPGTGFNLKTPDHFRIVYLPDVKELEKFGADLKDFLSRYKQDEVVANEMVASEELDAKSKN
jgi:alanine-synthesizing transaminase